MEIRFEKIFGQKIRKDFAFFKNNPKYIYLDSSLTSLKPKIIGETLRDFYNEDISTLERSKNKLISKTNKKYYAAIKTIEDFINADKDEIIITSGTTDGINKLVKSLVYEMNDGDEVIIGELEHSSLVLPWLANIKSSKKKIKIVWYKLNNYQIDLIDLKKIVNNKTKVIAMAGVYNTTGVLNEPENVRKIVGDKVKIILDAAQMAGHYPIDVKKLQIDYLVFGAHKVFGPNGVGIIWAKKDLLVQMEPFEYGGGMNITYDHHNFKNSLIPDKFMAGTPNVANVIGMAQGIKWISQYDLTKVSMYNSDLKLYAEMKLKPYKNIIILNPKVVSSNLLIKIDNVNAQDVSFYLEQNNIFARPGSSCVKIVNDIFDGKTTIRFSFHLYNKRSDVDYFCDKLITGGDFIDEYFR
ncbi:MAG: aminotransferase class V-fold PLP-dependent enzyme [Mycoplasmataceae bacterium]|nr:aminotransferase class V-fold PLP-dependent enzyme [Mycoplasmataceae bacterium]